MSKSETADVSENAGGGAASDEGYPRTIIAVNAVVSVVATLGIILWVNGFNLFYERLFRISPTVAGGGVGTDWVQGNSIGWLKLMIDLIHLVDFVMGAFILVMVFVHWGAFRRLAQRMQEPGESHEGVATDGGVRENGGERQ